MERALFEEEIPCWTSKVTIGGAEIYVKLGFWDTELCFIDLVFDRSPKNGTDTRSLHAKTKARSYDSESSQLETICHQANVLLQSGVWKVDDLINEWIATRFEPAGVSPSVGEVSSPLDAVAKLLKSKRDSWTRELKVKKNDGEPEQKQDRTRENPQLLGR